MFHSRIKLYYRAVLNVAGSYSYAERWQYVQRSNSTFDGLSQLPTITLFIASVMKTEIRNPLLLNPSLLFENKLATNLENFRYWFYVDYSNLKAGKCKKLW
jgi:hypothetical protein